MNLILRYKLNTNDYLQQVLYYNSINEESIKQRSKVWLFVIAFIIFFSVLLLFLFNDKIEFGHYLGAIPVAILSILFFPYFYKNILKKRFLKLVQKNYKNNFGKESVLSFHEEYVEIHDFTGESKVTYTSLEKIIEIKTHFFLILKAGAYIILPKSEIQDADSVKNTLDTIAAENEVLYSEELNWKW
ncbi:YcxB family protein [Allomuricauda sp. F6463D]|uniref:YcxB family protein n=1 Tax=Allomuricauda sp. F6463D TaxID=2926409 RepID=UPI001FF6C18D|nr:YcxB family protein [Muricauda sp. F6463D]MCK0159437.1 YcxB family protein [Muricauda sp. F6463D]